MAVTGGALHVFHLAIRIAEVLRDLYLLKGDTDLSFGERKMLDTARSLLIKELSLAKECSEDELESDLKKICNIV